MTSVAIGRLDGALDREHLGGRPVIHGHVHGHRADGLVSCSSDPAASVEGVAVVLQRHAHVARCEMDDGACAESPRVALPTAPRSRAAADPRPSSAATEPRWAPRGRRRPLRGARGALPARGCLVFRGAGGTPWTESGGGGTSQPPGWGRTAPATGQRPVVRMRPQQPLRGGDDVQPRRGLSRSSPLPLKTQGAAGRKGNPPRP